MDIKSNITLVHVHYCPLNLIFLSLTSFDAIEVSSYMYMIYLSMW